MARARGWCMTMNNYTEKFFDGLKDWAEKNVEYAVIGREVGESGTPHLQIYFEFSTMKSFKQMKKLHNKLHIEKRIGTKEQAANYCKKDGNYIEIGELRESKQGKRNDIENARELVKKGATMKEICEHSTSYQAIRCAELMRKYYNVKRNWKPTVYWYFGATGTGKSYAAFSESDPDNRWVSLDGLKWWDGYDGEPDVIIDDFRASDCRLKTLLRILDRYEYRVEHKGGSTQLLAKRIWITTPYHPMMTYKKDDADEDMKQLMRRIDVIKDFNKYDESDEGFDGKSYEICDDTIESE